MQQTTDRTKRRKLHNECGGPGPNSWGITGYATEGNSFETILKDERRRIGAVGFAIRAKVRVWMRKAEMENAKNGEMYQGGGRLPSRHSRESRRECAAADDHNARGPSGGACRSVSLPRLRPWWMEGTDWK
jgi:hypothetical protein